MQAPKLNLVNNDGGPAMVDAGAGRDGLNALIARLSVVLEDAPGPDHLFAEAEDALAAFAQAARVRILIKVGGRWRGWLSARSAEAEENEDDLVGQSGALHAAHPSEAKATIVIRPHAIVAVIEWDPARTHDLNRLEVAAKCVDLVLLAGERGARAARNASELQAIKKVADRILKSTDIEEILVFVVHEAKQMLESDICGVLMREADEVSMKACLGNFCAETSRLRMFAGVGVAGLVLKTTKPVTVDNYTADDLISRDFMDLARAEKVQSALAVPILSRDDVIGVLEVWRRRPSTFSQDNIELLVALADLTSLAIENSRLLQSYARAVDELASANDELASRYRVIEDSGHFQQQAINVMLRGGALSDIAGITAEQTDGAIFFLNGDLTVEASAPQQAKVTDASLARIRTEIKKVRLLSVPPLAKQVDQGFILVQPVLAGAELLGWIAWLGAASPPEITQLALNHAALVVATHMLERRTLARARAENAQAVLWDLLEGPDVVRSAAIDRARELRVTFPGAACVVIVELFSADVASGSNGEASSSAPALYDRVIEKIHFTRLGQMALMVGARGGQLRLICRASEAEPLEDIVSLAIDELRAAIPNAPLIAGVSTACRDMRCLPSFFREAVVALEVARHRQEKHVASYSQLGVMGLLVNLREKSNIRRLCEEILKDLLIIPPGDRDTMLETVRAFFECDCAQGETATRMGTHQKTVAYRLAKFSRLTNLNLKRHQDRVLADIGTSLYLTINE